MKHTRNAFYSTLLSVVLFASTLAAAGLSEGEHRAMTREVGHELITLANYGVFDNIMYQVDMERTVTLTGQVRQPALKTAAEQAVQTVDGVEVVNNEIEVLPVSSQDDAIRIATYHAIYGNPALSRYALRSQLPIHIMVKNGDVELVGYVANEGDKNIAGIQTHTVAGVHEVVNNLELARP